MRDVRVRTTMAIHRRLLEEADRLVKLGKAESRTAVVEAALREHFARLRASEVDAAFAAMAEDLVYQEEARRIAQEFETGERHWGDGL